MLVAGAFVDRTGDRRKDPDWLAEALANSESRFVPVWRNRCLAGGEPPRVVLLQRDAIQEFISEDNAIFLGLFRNQPAFAVAIDPAIDPPFGLLGEFVDLRTLGTMLPPDEANRRITGRILRYHFRPGIRNEDNELLETGLRIEVQAEIRDRSGNILKQTEISSQTGPADLRSGACLQTTCFGRPGRCRSRTTRSAV